MAPGSRSGGLAILLSRKCADCDRFEGKEGISQDGVSQGSQPFSSLAVPMGPHMQLWPQLDLLGPLCVPRTARARTPGQPRGETQELSPHSNFLLSSLQTQPPLPSLCL